MIGITLLLSWPPCWFSIYAPPTRQSVELVRKLGSAEAGERERIKKELMDRPDALWPVLWGTRHDNLEIVIACSQIVEEWSWRSRLAEMVRSVDGHFDRFVNSVLYSRARDLDLFAAVSEKGRALDRYYVRKSFLRDPKGFPGLAADWGRVPTPFHQFAVYVQGTRPVTHDGFLRVAGADSKPWLAKSDGVDTPIVSASMVLSEGNVNVMTSGFSLIVCGGDVTIDHNTSSSLIIAAGDVRLKRSVVHSFIIAGGKVTVEPTGYLLKLFVISPSKTVVTGRARVTGPLVILDDKPKPAQELFSFRDLWADYGLEGGLEKGRVRITKVKRAGPMASFFQENDIVLARGKTKIESVGQFRRLLGHARDTGRLEFQVERGGQERAIRANLKKPADKR